jgi:hypothetical protein
MNKITRDDTEHGVEYVRADEAQAEVLEQCRIIAMGAEREDALRAEVERLNKALTWEQNRAERIGTHGPGCHTWGSQHYECLLREHERLKASIALDKKAENARELGLSYDDEPARQDVPETNFGNTAAQPAVQEPVGEVSGHDWSTGLLYRDLEPGTPLYTAPQPVPVKTYHDGKPWPVAPKLWVGLTDEEAQWIYDNGRTPSGMMEMVEAKLKELNT